MKTLTKQQERMFKAYPELYDIIYALADCRKSKKFRKLKIYVTMYDGEEVMVEALNM